METSFTRKFILKELPPFTKSSSSLDSRFYLYSQVGTVIRVQSKNGAYEIERKIDLDGIKKISQRIAISDAEFLELGKLCPLTIVRETITYTDLPNYKFRVYKERFEGLLRAEVSFSSLEDLQNYVPASWLGSDISLSPLAKDESLLNLTDSEFKKNLSTYLIK